MKFLFLGLYLFSFILINTNAIAAPVAIDPTEVTLPVPSSRAQTLYKTARNDLLQIRVLLKNGRTQSSVGSGFLIGTSNLVVTNYHVVSQIVMYPENYVGEFIDTNGERGNVKLLAVDALHDLAVVSISRNGNGYFNVPDALPTLTQGQYLYSLGNPLDLGFAISEGAYNGVIRRGFYDQFMFTGPINAGMSGGPNITQDGRVAGVNVSKRLDGELVSFLVPVAYVRDLLKVAKRQLAESAKSKPVTDIAFKKVVGRQLLAHQDAMLDNILAQPLTLKTLGDYQVPVRESDQMRCWGSSNDSKESPYDFSSINCAMESAIFVSNNLQVGQIAIRHEYIKATDMGSLRFSVLQSSSFKNEQFGNDKDINRTAPMCKEQFVNNTQLPMRAVLCVRAYREFDDLYDFSLITAATDESLISLQSRLDASGVSYDNGLRLASTFLNGLGRTDTTVSKAVTK
jgi:serine protease Do